MSERALWLSRRRLLSLGAGACVLSLFPLAARARRRVIRRTFPVMGTTADFIVIDRDVARADMAIDAAMGELRRVDRLMSRFRAESDVGRANQFAGSRPAVVSAESASLIGLAVEWARATGGAFDPAIGSVVELWDVSRRHAPPPPSDVRRLAGRHFYRAIEIGNEGRHLAVQIAEPSVHIDLGGIAAGFGVDLAVDALRAYGITNALVNVSGDIYALGHSGNDAPWRIGVRSPARPDEIISTVEVSDGAVATSGDYEQFFRYRGERYHHLMDPETAAPSRRPLHSVTVCAERCVDADAASTAAFVLGAPSARGILAARGVRIVDVA